MATDPFAGLTQVQTDSAPEASGADPFSGLTAVKPAGTYSVDEFLAAKDEDLVNDKDFSPKDFAVENKQALQNNQAAMEKAVRIYEGQDKKSTSFLSKVGTAVKSVPKVLKALYQGGKTAVEYTQKLNPDKIFVDLAKGAIKGDIEPVIREKIGNVADVLSGAETASTQSIDLGRRAVRGAAEKVTGNEPDYKKRFFDDVAVTEVARNSAQGNGETAKALSADANSLKEYGIEINPEAVQALSTVYDPINFIPVGAGVGFTAKVAGKTGKFVLARALNAEQAAKLATILNDAKKAVSATAEGAKGIAGSTLETAGQATRKIGEVAQEVGTTTAATVGGLATGSFPGAAAGIAVAKTAPRILQLAGKSAESLGKLAKGARPPTPFESVVGGAVSGAAKGAAEGAAVTFPLMIGATPQEQEALLGGVGLAGAIRGAGEAGGAAGRAAQNKLSETVYRAVERAETPESPYYGTDGALDAAHAAEVQNLPKNEQTVLNYFRNFLKDSGIEIYALDQNTFTGRVPKAEGAAQAKGFFTEVGERVTPEGQANPVVRIFLNGGADALGHEIFHALESLDPESANNLRESITSSWTPEQKEAFKEQYNTSLNGGKPKDLWTQTLSDKDVASEVSAEVFSRVLNATDLSGVAAPIQQRAANFLSSVLEKLKIPVEGKAVTSAKNFSEIQKYIQNLSERVNEHGTVATVKRVSPLKGATEVVTEAGLTPEHPLGVGPRRTTQIEPEVTAAKPVKVKESEIPVAPKTPSTAPVEIPESTTRNIRTTRSAQNDFAAQRAEVTGIESANALAKKLGKEVEERVSQINRSLESGSAVEIEHSGVRSESTAEKPLGRTGRRAEQEAAYLKENLGSVPKSIREAHQKVFVPVRWETIAGKPQLLAMSLDKVIANVHRSVSDAAKAKVENLIPYETRKGKLTESAWKEVVSDLKAYADNQSHGYRGSGERLTRPSEDVGLSIPAEDPKYSPIRISEDRANFLNLVQGLNPPLTAREVRGAGTPGNVKGQIVAEVNQRTPQTPAKIRPEDINKQTFKSGRTVKETNPLRNQLSEAGVPVRELIEVTERINAPDIISVRNRSDLGLSAPVTDIIRGGFLPEGVSIEKIIESTPEQWREMINSPEWEKSLTKTAFRTGLSLKTPEELSSLRKARAEMEEKGRAAMAMGDYDAASPLLVKGQFFREAIEAATDTGSAAGSSVGWRKFYPDGKPPFAAGSETPRQSFMPATDFGKALKKDGFDFADAIKGGNRVVYLLKDGKEMGFIAAKEVSPGSAEIKMVELDKGLRGTKKGLGEAMYREILTRLKDEGITQIVGTVVAPEPLAIRKKIFGDFDTLELNLEPVKYEEALDAANRIKQGDTELLNIDAVNRIDPNQTF